MFQKINKNQNGRPSLTLAPILGRAAKIAAPLGILAIILSASILITSSLQGLGIRNKVTAALSFFQTSELSKYSQTLLTDRRAFSAFTKYINSIAESAINLEQNPAYDIKIALAIIQSTTKSAEIVQFEFSPDFLAISFSCQTEEDAARFLHDLGEAHLFSDVFVESVEKEDGGYSCRIAAYYIV